MKNLSAIDYEILKYICDHEPVRIKKLKSKFHKVLALENRLNDLSKLTHTTVPSEFSHVPMPIAIPDTSYIVKNTSGTVTTYSTTELGKKIIDSYVSNRKKHNKELWLVNVKMPIITAFVTTLLTLAITHWLLPKLPRILQWFADILSKCYK